MKSFIAAIALAVVTAACSGTSPTTGATDSPTASAPTAAAPSPTPTTWTQVATFSGKGQLKTTPFDLQRGQARLRITWQGGPKDPSASSSGVVYIRRPGVSIVEGGLEEQLFLSQDPGTIEQAFYPDSPGQRYLGIEPRDNVRSWEVVVEELR